MSRNPASTAGTDVSVYQIKATLIGFRPPIWRRLRVTGDTTLHRLHRMLQIVMGWWDYHLYQFDIGRAHYGIRDPEWDPEIGIEVRSARIARLGRVVPSERTVFWYKYDFGDGWEIRLVVERILPPQQGERYPVCLGGERAGPHEDSGGIPGHAQVVKVLRDPTHPEHEEMRTWAGPDYEPERFDLAGANTKLARFRASSVGRRSQPKTPQPTGFD
jgi:pRiA4b ORF-3-like protein